MEETYAIQTLEQVKSISNKVRIRILHLQSDAKPRTVAQIAQELELPPFKVQLHIQELLRVGLFYVVETDQPSTNENDTYYLPIARTFYTPQHVAGGNAALQEAQGQVGKVLFDSFVLDYRRAIKEAEQLQKAGLVATQTNPETNIGWLFMTPEQRAEFTAELLVKMEEWEKKYAKQNSPEGATPWQMFFSLLPNYDAADE
ncbi:MAG: hypothetical protein ACXVC1_00040 [Tumebacillaceae bacterium]